MHKGLHHSMLYEYNSKKNNITYMFNRGMANYITVQTYYGALCDWNPKQVTQFPKSFFLKIWSLSARRFPFCYGDKLYLQKK